MRFTGVLVVMSALTPASMVAGAILSPVSYDMTNGRSGFNTYRDDTYGGPGSSGNPAVDSSALAGGLGQLTDGVVGTNDLFANSSFDWVGWLEVRPVIRFDFGQVVSLETLEIHAASHSSMFGDVDLPGTIRWEFSDDGMNYSGTIDRVTSMSESLNTDSQWLGVTTARHARYARATLFDGVQPWIFVSEVRFEGVPSPGAAGLIGLAGMCAARRRRS